MLLLHPLPAACCLLPAAAAAAAATAAAAAAADDDDDDGDWLLLLLLLLLMMIQAEEETGWGGGGAGGGGGDPHLRSIFSQADEGEDEDEDEGREDEVEAQADEDEGREDEDEAQADEDEDQADEDEGREADNVDQREGRQEADNLAQTTKKVERRLEGASERLELGHVHPLQWQEGLQHREGEGVRRPLEGPDVINWHIHGGGGMPVGGCTVRWQRCHQLPFAVPTAF